MYQGPRTNTDMLQLRRASYGQFPRLPPLYGSKPTQTSQSISPQPTQTNAKQNILQPTPPPPPSEHRPSLTYDTATAGTALPSSTSQAPQINLFLILNLLTNLLTSLATNQDPKSLMETTIKAFMTILTPPNE